MFDINSIRMQNFKSFSGKHFLTFPKEPGLYHITGENLYNPRLGANGAGKTTLIDAVQWCLHGSSTRGLKAGDIVTWGKNKTIVEIYLKIKNKKRLVCRGQNPNFLELNGKTITQDELTAILKLDKESFNFAIVIPQFNKSFFDLTSTTKLNLFSQLMNLDWWLERSADAANVTKGLDNLINSLTNTIHNQKIAIENVNFDIAQLKDKKKMYEDASIEHYEDLKDQRLVAGNEDTRITAKIIKLSTQIKKALKKQKLTKTKIATINNDISGINKNVRLYENNLLKINLKLDDLKSSSIKLKEVRSNFCPICGQHVNKEYVKEHLKPIKDKIQNLKLSKFKDTDDIEKLEWAWNIATKSLKLNEKRWTEVTIKLDKKRSKQTTLEHKRIVTKNLYDNLHKQMQVEKERENPFTDLLKTKLTDKKGIRVNLKATRVDKIQAEKEYEAINFWISGFKRVRLYIIEQALKNLELEINNNFATLGLTDWSVEFDIERETKARGVSRGFNVFLKSPKHDKPVLWEAWSGGETGRLRIAGDLGLANLILEHNGLESAIEFHDEPSEHMTTEGIDDMLETLYQRAHNLGKKIWLIDHETTNFGGFSGVVKVTMDKKGNSNLNLNGG